jgi:hypothetical protein
MGRAGIHGLHLEKADRHKGAALPLESFLGAARDLGVFL